MPHKSPLADEPRPAMREKEQETRNPGEGHNVCHYGCDKSLHRCIVSSMAYCPLWRYSLCRCGKGVMTMRLEHEELTSKIISAGIEVHRALGPGFLESIYENALVVELRRGGLKVQQQVEVSVRYTGVEVGKHCLDLLVDDTIIVELKAIKAIDDVHYAIAKSYIKATGRQHALLLNFAKVKLEIKRIGLSTPDLLAS